MPINFHPATPILRVANLEASRAHYTEILGFTEDWGDRWFASMTRGRCTLFLCEGDQGHPGGWVWIGVSDADALCAELRAKGARIRHEPTNYPWAREFQVADLDGNVLRLGSDVPDGARMGEWLDAAGVRWAPVEGGGWSRVEPD